MVAYAATISACQRAGHAAQVQKLFKEMRQQAVPASAL